MIRIGYAKIKKGQCIGTICSVYENRRIYDQSNNVETVSYDFNKLDENEESYTSFGRYDSLEDASEYFEIIITNREYDDNIKSYFDSIDVLPKYKTFAYCKKSLSIGNQLIEKGTIYGCCYSEYQNIYFYDLKTANLKFIILDNSSELKNFIFVKNLDSTNDIDYIEHIFRSMNINL